MPFEINTDVLALKDYNKILSAVRDGVVVSLLPPLHTRDEIYEISAAIIDPHPPSNMLFSMSGRIVFGEDTDIGQTLETFRRTLEEKEYIITDEEQNIKLSHDNKQNLYILTIEKEVATLSSIDVLALHLLQENIPIFLNILETLVNTAYSVSGSDRDLAIIPIPMREPDYRPRDMEEAQGGRSNHAERFEIIPREFLDIDFDDIGGCEDAKEKMMLIDLGIRFPKIYDIYKVELPRGIMLYGPPGTGKTLLAKAAAKELDADFYSVSGADFLSKWYGESEKNLKLLFDKAKMNTPSVIFIDEIDALMPQRDESHEATVRVISLLLQEMDGIKSSSGIIIMGATNRPNKIDPAFLRPGRFDLKLEIPLPDERSLEEIFKIHLHGRILDDNIDYQKLARESNGLSGADVKGVVDSCVFQKIVDIRNRMPDVISRDDVESIDIEPITNQDLLKTIDKYKAELNALVCSLGSAGMYA